MSARGFAVNEHHHGSHLVRARNVRNIVTLHAHGNARQTEQFAQLHHRAHGHIVVPLAHGKRFFQKVLGVGFRHIRELAPYSLVRTYYVHLFALYAGKIFRHGVLVVKLHGRDHLVRHVSHLGSVTRNIRGKGAFFVQGYVLYHLLIAAKQLAAAHEKHRRHRVQTAGSYGENVYVQVFRKRGHLSAHELVEHFQLLLVVKRLFVVLALGSRPHAPDKHFFHFFVVPAQKRDDPVHLFFILFPAHTARTRSKTPAYVVVEAGTVRGGNFVHIKTARTQGKRRIDKVGYVPARNALHIRTEILRAVRFQLSHHFHAREVRLYVYADKGIVLVVFEKNVVRRLVLFYQIVFQHQGLYFVARDDVIESVYFGNHARHLFRLYAGIEVLAHPVFQNFGFADIQNLPRLRIHYVNAAGHGQVFYFLTQNIVHRYYFIISRAAAQRLKE